MAHRVGESIQDFHIQSMLGFGGFAEVFSAKSLKTGQDIAMKMIDKRKMNAKNMANRVKKEVEIHSRVNHPSVLQLYSYFEDEDYVYLALEMCENGDFYSFLKAHNQVLREDEARHYMKQVVDGLLYLHSHGILHRDLTLANLLLTKDMDVKIGDFGLATQVQNADDKQFTICGTPNFISPEVAARRPHGLEADVWSVGCMLYTMLVGRPPFHSDNIKNTLDRVVSAEYDLPASLSGSAKNLVQSLLQKNPKDRIPLHMILSHPFFNKNLYLTSHFGSSQNLNSKQHYGSTMDLNSTLSKPLDICPEPISSMRLKPIRQKTKNAVLNIFDNGVVCLEFFKRVENKEEISDVFFISPDGQQIQIFEIAFGRRIPVTENSYQPSSADRHEEYSYECLPQRYWKRYGYASRFVNLVRSKTPKVTLLTPRAKSILMENSPNPVFEVIFNDGFKFVKNGEEMRITKKSELLYKFKSNANTESITPSLRHKLDYVNQCHSQCLHLESSLTSVERREQAENHVSCFPAIVDRRSKAENNKQGSMGVKDEAVLTRHSELNSERSNSPNSSGSSGFNSISSGRANSSNNSSSNSRTSDTVCKVFVRGIGWGSQLPSGEILVQFDDGCDIIVQPSPMLVTFTDSHGKCTRYGTSDVVPPKVHSKLGCLPVIMNRLEARQTEN